MTAKRYLTDTHRRPDIRPNVAGLPDRDDNSKVVFSFAHADTDYVGAWSWFTDREAGLLLPFLREVSQRSWHDLYRWRERGKLIHHEQSVDTVCPAAQERFGELGLDERSENLFRFGMGYTERLWGFVTASVFYILWWDARHQVCPFEE
jgi:hypothetical protein